MGTKAVATLARVDAFRADPEDLVLIEDPKHPLYDKRVHLPLDEKLILSIMASGVKVAILCRRNGDKTEVVDGRQRVKNAREANKRLKKEGKEPVSVKMLLERGSDADIFGVTCLANEHRQSDGPLERAHKAQRLIGFGKTDAEVCNLFGWTKPTLKYHLALLDTTPRVQRAVEAGKLGTVAAAQLARLSREEQDSALTAALESGGGEEKKANTRAVTNKVREAKGQTASNAPGKKEIKRLAAYLIAVEEKNTLDAVDAGVLHALKWVLDGARGRYMGLLLTTAHAHRHEAEAVKKDEKVA